MPRMALARSLRFEEAAEVAREATLLMPDAMQAWGNLYSALRDAGRIEEVLAVLREATKRLPKDASLLSHLLAGLNYSPSTDASEARALAERFGSLLGPEDRIVFTNSKDPDRPLRVAFLSSDLRTHSVAFFVEPILRALDRASILPIVYSISPKKPGAADEDATTARLRSLTHEWHEVGDSRPRTWSAASAPMSDSILSAGRALSYYLLIACLVLCLLGTAIGRLSLKPSDNKATTF